MTCPKQNNWSVQPWVKHVMDSWIVMAAASPLLQGCLNMFKLLEVCKTGSPRTAHGPATEPMVPKIIEYNKA